MEWWVFVPLIAGFIALAVWNYRQKRKRIKALEELAKVRRLLFDPSERHGVDDEYPQFSCLARGEDRYAFNCLSGDWEKRELFAFDYHYETYSTDSKGRRQTHHHYFSAVIVTSDVPLKPLFLRPESFLDRVGEFFGFDDIDFESAEFSRRFYVKSPDRRWAYDVLHQRTMEFLLHSPNFYIEFGPRGVIAYRHATFAVAEFEAAAEVASGILNCLPEYLVKQQTGRS